MDRPTFKTLRRIADKHFSKECRKLGHCLNCRSTKNLQWCHIISRKYFSLRYSKDNCVCLCASCHAKFTDNPIAFAEFIKRVKSNKIYKYLKQGRFNHVKDTKKYITEILEKENFFSGSKTKDNSKVWRKMRKMQTSRDGDTPPCPEHNIEF